MLVNTFWITTTIGLALKKNLLIIQWHVPIHLNNVVSNWLGKFCSVQILIKIQTHAVFLQDLQIY